MNSGSSGMSQGDRKAAANNKNTLNDYGGTGLGASPAGALGEAQSWSVPDSTSSYPGDRNTYQNSRGGVYGSDKSSNIHNSDGSLKESGGGGYETGGSYSLGEGGGGGGGIGSSAKGQMFAGSRNGPQVDQAAYDRQKLESQLVLKEQQMRGEYFNKLNEVNSRLANIGPDEKFYKTIQDRLMTLDKNPDSVINTSAYKDYRDNLMRSYERQQNAIGRSADGESMVRAEGFLRHGYINDLRNFYGNLLGQASGVQQAGIQAFNQSSMAQINDNPYGNMLGAVGALGQVGKGINDQGAQALLSQIEDMMKGKGKAGGGSSSMRLGSR